MKESNRLDIMVNSLGAMGCDIEGTDDGYDYPRWETVTSCFY